ncbi:MAG: glycosyltransferase family 2 protein [Eubacteriales bacterium]|nr:glycosyltransferase family 2 protein [Eubacteriales bacterium]
MDLSIVIINHNTRELTGRTVASVLAHTSDVAYEIIVVDNSTDAGEVYPGQDDPRVRVLADVENKGFSHGCNLGAAHAAGAYLLFLNSDILVHDNALGDSAAYLKAHPDVGILGIRTLLRDGTLDAGCKRGFPTPAAALYYFAGLDRRYPNSRRFGVYHQTFLDDRQTARVQAVSGAYLMMPKAVFDRVGGFDESYFMYGEDLDLCYRVDALGYAVVYYAGHWITHLKGQSGLSRQSPAVLYHYYHAMRLFFDKHYAAHTNPALRFLVRRAIHAKYRLALKSRRGA